MSWKVRSDMQDKFGKTVEPGTKEFGEYMNAAAEAGRKRSKKTQEAGPPYRRVEVIRHRWYHFWEECGVCGATIFNSGWFAIHDDESWGAAQKHYHRICEDCGINAEFVLEIFQDIYSLPPFNTWDISRLIGQKHDDKAATKWRKAAFARRDQNRRRD